MTAVAYTWEEAGPLGLGIAADPDGVVVESVVAAEVAAVVEPGMLVLSVGGRPVGPEHSIDQVIQMIKQCPRPLTIQFELPDWDDQSLSSDDDAPTDGLDASGAPTLSDAEPSSGSEEESPRAEPGGHVGGRGDKKAISEFIVHTLMTAPMFREQRNMATVELHRPLGVGLIALENGDISVCAVPGEEAQAKKVAPGMILVEIAGELLTKHWKLADVRRSADMPEPGRQVARVVKSVPDGLPVTMVFALERASGVPVTKAEEEARAGLCWRLRCLVRRECSRGLR